MPTKPTDTLPEWASTATFPGSVYPATLPWGVPHPLAGQPTVWSGQPTTDATGLAGFAAQAHVPAVPTPAPTYNEWLRRNWAFVNWVELGDFNPIEEPRVVEADGSGFVRAVQFVGSGTAAGSPAFVGTGTGANHAGVFTGGPGGGSGVRGFGTGSSAGGAFDGGPTDGPGVTGLGGGANGAGVNGLGVGTGIGVFGQSLGSADGVQGQANATGTAGVRGVQSATAGAAGVQGESPLLADSASSAVLGLSRGDAAALNGNATEDGYALQLFAAGNRPVIGANVRTGPPTTLTNADLWPERPVGAGANDDDIRWRTWRNGNTRQVHDSAGGYFTGRFEQASGSNNNAVTYTTVGTINVRPPTGGLAKIRLIMEAGNVAIAANDMEIEIRDITGAPVVLYTQIVELDQSVASHNRTYAVEIEANLVGGNNTLDVRVRKSNGGTATGIQWRGASCWVQQT